MYLLFGRASIILASSSTASYTTCATATASTATFVYSSSAAHLEKVHEIYANVTIDKTDRCQRYNRKKVLVRRVETVTSFFKIGIAES
jgi:hypothetical protein